MTGLRVGCLVGADEVGDAIQQVEAWAERGELVGHGVGALEPLVTGASSGIFSAFAEALATHGSFAGGDATRIADEVTVNVTTVVGLTRALLPGMLARQRGAVVNVASTAAFQPVPFMAVYGATKAFVLSFTEALWGELVGTGVTALALCPGATQTEFFDIAGNAASVGRRQTPEQVVATAMRALGRRTPPPSVVSGRGNALSARLPRLVPRRTTITITRRLMTANA